MEGLNGHFCHGFYPQVRPKSHKLPKYLVTGTVNHVYQMSGNQISVKTLDLNQEFSDIQNQLNKIVKDHFGISIRQ